MFLDTIDPCRFNYLKKRIDTDSEILPLFENSSLVKYKNVKLLSIYAQEPVIYSFKEHAKIIHLDKIKKLEMPEKNTKPSEIFDAFFETYFFDLMISNFKYLQLCMSRIDQYKWKMSVLLSTMDEQDADEVLRNPSILLEKYQFEEKEELSESNNAFDLSKYKTSNISEELSESTNAFDLAEFKTLNISEDKQAPSENLKLFENNEPILVQEIQINPVKDEIQPIFANEPISESETVTVNESTSGNDQKTVTEFDKKVDKAPKKSFFGKIKQKISKLYKKENKEPTQAEKEPGHIILGQKLSDNVIRIQKKRLVKNFNLKKDDDLKFLKRFLENKIYFLEIDCTVKVTIIKEEKTKIFIYSEVNSDDDAIITNIEQLQKHFNDPKSKEEKKK